MKIAYGVAMALAMTLTSVTISGCSVANHQETAGQYVDGTVMTAKVKAKIANELGVADAANITVKTIQGGIVQLSGFAKTQSERTRAGEIARSVEGVAVVHNNLVVAP
ncbi:MAG: BON domain-containing protein [Burkholderiaceae bacterium]|nr:MAG: BON domain-containing protein [Burkholderiaceae bacterium]TAM03920.1 MAG: BON domain-containing protein [Pusillimonas sp.]